MATPKYKKQYEEMMKLHQETFDLLKTLDRTTQEFKELQRKVLRIVRQNEDALCKKTEHTYTSFSTTLGDKFMEEVRIFYPEIDFS